MYPPTAKIRWTITVLCVLAAARASAVDFVKDVAQIFESHCVRCHGPDQKKGKFSLATREEFFAGGKAGVSVVARPVVAFNEVYYCVNNRCSGASSNRSLWRRKL